VRGIDRLGPFLDVGADPADEPDLRVRKRTAVATALLLIVATLVFAAAYIPYGIVNVTVIALAQIAAFAAAIVLFARTRRLGPFVGMLIAVGLTLLIVNLVPTAGLSSSSSGFVWAVLAPVGAVLFLGPRAGRRSLVVVLFVFAVTVAIDPFVQGPPTLPASVRTVLIAVNFALATAVALAMVVFIDGERVRAKAESDALLLNVLPRSIADRLKAGEAVIADHYDSVTVLFSDLCDFTPLAAADTPAHVVALLNEIFSQFDALAERHGVEKIKTIGDSYMVVGGVPEPRGDHATAIVEMAIAMHAAVSSIKRPDGAPLQIRTGIATGPAVAGVIGQRKFSYDLWGDAVNVASRMESTGIPGLIQLSPSTWRLCADRYRFSPRQVEVKGIGPMTTYLLDPAAVALMVDPS